MLSSVPQASTQKLWKNAQGQSIGTLDNVQISQPGQYTLTVTKTIGNVTCFRTDTVLIGSSQDIPTLSAASAGIVNCTGASVQLSTQTNANNPVFSWSGPNGFSSSAPAPAVTTGGTYSVTVSAPNGCTATASVNVATNTTIPTIQLSADSISCTVDSAQLSAQTNAALPGFAWSGPNGFTATSAQPVTFSGGLYTLIVVDSINGCRDTATVEVGLDVGVPILSAVSSGPIGCLSPSITLQATTQNGPASFAWTGPAGFVSGDSNPSVGLAGEYIVTASTPNGCTATASIVVSGDTNLPDLSVTGDTLTCTAPEANIAGSSNTTGVAFAWTGPGNFASDQSMLKVSTAGEYVLTVTAPNGCSASATVPVLSDQIPPDVAATGAGLDCLHPSVVITGTSAAANAAFSWTGPDGFSSQMPDNTVALPGDYTLTVQTPNGCTATAVASVGQDTLAPDVQALSDGDITCLHPTAALSGSSGVPTASFFWTGPGGSSNTADLSTNTGGNYLLTVTHPQNGCTAQASVFVVVDTLKPLVVVASSILTCTKDSVQLLSDALGNNLLWAWTGPDNFSSTEPNPTVSLPGDYLLTLTNQDNGCVTLLTEAVQADQAPPFVSAVSGQLSCAQPSLNLTASSTPPGTFAWAGPNGFVSTETDPVVQVAGSYQLTATAANGCTATTTVVVDSDFNLPGASALGDTIDCFSGSALLAGSSPDLVTWAWSGPGNFNSSEQNPQVTTAGDYTLVVTGQNGCSATATATVNLNQDAPDVDITGAAGLNCLVTSLQLSASVADPIVSGQWNTGAQSSSISISSPGTYSYTAQGLSGCITTQSVNIQQDTAAPQNVAATGGQLTCSLTTLSLNGSATGTALSWQWSGPSGFTSTTQNPANVTTPGQYILVVTNTSNGCTASATAPVTEDPSIPEISATADTLNCKEASVEIALVANRPDLTYAWSGPNGFSASQANPAVTAPGLYTLLATAPNGCTATITLSVAQDIALPEVLAQADTLSCTKMLGTLSGSSPSPGALPQWTGPGNFTATQWSTTATLAGPYQLSVTGTNGCSTATTVVMAEDKVKPKVTAKGDTLTCSVLQIALDAQADVQALWQWSGPGNFSSGIQQPFASAAGTYTVTVTGPNGCSASATAFVYADQQSPQLSILPPDEIDCQTAQVSLAAQAQGTGSFVFQWETGNGLIVAGANTATATAGMGGLYTVTVTNLHNACTATQSVTVPVNANVPTSMNIRSSDISCYGKMDGALVVESVSGGTPPFLFSLDAAAFAAASVFQGLSPGAHTLQLQDAAGCELQSSVFLQEPGPFTVSLGPDTTIHLGAPILLAVGSAVNLPQRIDKFTTSPFQLGQDSIIFPLRSFIYTLSVSDTNGCSAAGKRLILVDKRRNVYVPNAFGPGSLSNSIFTLFGGVDVRLVHRFQIFDRWGTLVHERRQFLPQDLSAAWDGTFRGDVATPGVFTYYFEIEFIDGEVEVFSGDVTLIR